MSTQATKPEKKSYKDTLNLPQTAFAMEAKLVANEPLRLKRWQDSRLYDQVMKHRAGAPKWLLHDGPPFANADIHIGHVINKTLKDVFIRYKSMRGFLSPYIPGWDCHGLPIEHKITTDLGSKARELPVLEIRKRCFEHADKYAKLQSVQFQRLGVLGDWDHPYMTMAPRYEASTLEVFARFVEAGLVYRQLKPVQWSIANQTALADAELEYKDVDDNSVFVEFASANPGAFKGKFDLKLNVKVSFMIWTTTPWTLPANMAIAVHPDVVYALVKYKRNEDWHLAVVAADLVKAVMEKGAVSDVEVVKTVRGRELVGLEYQHPFVERLGKILPAEYVTTTDGTGLVHTAPGHGEDDYHTGISNGIEVYCPVQANGRFDSTVPEWLRGLTVWESNPKITDRLRDAGVLFAEQRIRHSYPHDWRSKTPTIFRATEQWFVSIERPFKVADAGEHSVRDRAMRAIEQINFIPDWGRARIKGMLENRPDWCISRQRAWGLPIPVFYNESGEALLTPDSVRAVARRFAEKGSDAWFTESPEQLLQGCDPGAKFPKDKLRKERDIFDVWFESGSSWNAVLRNREDNDSWRDLPFPADLYLEGSDQHRGWFQLSLLPSLGATGQSPFKQVLTHGFIVKPDGTKVSKSDKEYVTAMQEIERHGADLLRLWCCSMDYTGDMPASPQVIKDFGDKYRKIRNSVRYLLSNLYDFDPSKHAQTIPAASLDGWALAELDALVAAVTRAMDEFQTHLAFKLIYEFCNVQLSAVYGNAMKDRLYCDAQDSPLRRRAQTVMHRMVTALVKLLAPMVVFTADEAWEHVAHKPTGEQSLDSVHLTSWPAQSGEAAAEAQRGEWSLLMDLRDKALFQLDRLKKEAGMNKALDAEVVYPGKLRAQLEKYGVDLEDLVGAGSYSFDDSCDDVRAVDRRNDYPACARSWKRRKDVGSDPQHPDLSARDAAAVRNR